MEFNLAEDNIKRIASLKKKIEWYTHGEAFHLITVAIISSAGIATSVCIALKLLTYNWLWASIPMTFTMFLCGFKRLDTYFRLKGILQRLNIKAKELKSNQKELQKVITIVEHEYGTLIKVNTCGNRRR